MLKAAYTMCSVELVPNCDQNKGRRTYTVM